jgi:hypothetical protein
MTDVTSPIGAFPLLRVHLLPGRGVRTSSETKSPAANSATVTIGDQKNGHQEGAIPWLEVDLGNADIERWRFGS